MSNRPNDDDALTLLAETENYAVLIGEDADNIESQLAGVVPIRRASSMREAVDTAYDAAAVGDAVLLAPACASFDMFRSFEDRGTVFKAEVTRLVQGELGAENAA